MKSTLVAAAVCLIAGCAPGPADNPPPSFSVNKYSTPVFPDSASFGQITQAFPVIEKVFAAYAEKNHMPAIAFGLIVGDSLVFAHASGLSNIETKTKASPQSLFRIASMSKSFTAMGILKLRDEGKLTLTDKASKYIPDLKKAGLPTTDSPDITILHLLTMSAGFPEDNPWGDRQLADTDEELLAMIGGGISYANTAGTTFEYSNTGFAMLGRIITVVSGVPYQKYITENIMKPIGMTHSRWEYDDVPPAELALGYRWEDESFKAEPLLHDGAYGAMGGMICSIEDFAKYVSLHLGAWPARNAPETGPVRRSSLREMHQPWRVSGLFADARTRSGESCPVATGYGYGLGWRKDCKNNVRISHSGGLPGFGSEWRIYPEYGIGVVSFSNLTYGAPGLPNAIALDTLIQLAGLKPRTLPPSEILQQRKQQLADLLGSWKEEQLGVFAENFFLDKSLEDWKESSAQILQTAGVILNVSAVKAVNQLRGTFILKGENKEIAVFFTLTPEHDAKIQELDLSIAGDK